MNGNEPKPACSKSVKKSSKWNRNQQKCEVHPESPKKSTDDGDIPPGHDPRYPVIIKEHEFGIKYPSGHKIIYVKNKYLEQDKLIKEDEKFEQQPKLDKISHHVSTDDGDISPGHVPRFPFVSRRGHKSSMKYPSGPRITHAKSKYIEEDKLIKEDEEKAEQQQDLLGEVKGAFQDETCDVVYFTSQAELRGEVIKQAEEKGEHQQEEPEDKESSQCGAASGPRITHEKSKYVERDILIKEYEKVERQPKLDKVSHHVSTDDGNISPGHVPRFPFVTRRDHKSGMKYPSGPRITHAKSKYIEEDKLIKEDEEKAEQQQELLSEVKGAFQDETCDVVYFTSQAELRGEVIKEGEEKGEQQEEPEDKESSQTEAAIVEYLPNNEIIIESTNYLPNYVPKYFEPQGRYTSLNKFRNFSKVSKETLCFISGIPFIPGHIYFEIDRQENENQRNKSQENGSDENDSDEELDEVKWPMIDKTPSYLTGTN